MFPTEEDQDKEVITIMGKKEAVEKAKADLEATIKEIVRESFFSNNLYVNIIISEIFLNIFPGQYYRR